MGEEPGSSELQGERRPTRLDRRPSAGRRAFASGLSLGSPEVRGINESVPVRQVARRESVYRRLLAGADLLGAALAITLTIQVLGEDSARPLMLFALPLVVLVAKVQGLYDRDALLLNKTTLDEAPKLFMAAAVYTLLVKLDEGWLLDGNLGSRQLLGLWLLLFGISILGRHAARGLARRATGTERLLVIGSLADQLRIAMKLADNPGVSAEVVGRVSSTAEDDVNGDALGSLGGLEHIVGEHGIHRVIVVPHTASAEHMLDAIRAAKAVGVQVSVLPRMMEVVGSSVEFDHLYGMTVLGVRRFGLSRSSQLIKRTLDLVGAAVGLVVLSPILATLALAVKRSSPGGVLFRQQRVGKDGALFEVAKFRTMVEGAEALKAELHGQNEAPDGLFKIAEDPRVTRVGRFLRRSSLDELPQLVNVMRGQMSLVGPRPLVPEEDSRIEGRHRRRLHLKPGMTGQWQIFGSSKIPLREMVTIDYLYVANWSLWGDIKILCRTLPYILARRGL